MDDKPALEVICEALIEELKVAFQKHFGAKEY